MANKPLSREFLLNRGFCCNNGCLNCPYKTKPTMTKEQIAQVAHEINRAYCAALGDHSQAHWEDAPEWQRKSAVNGVEFHLSNPNAGPSASHESWMKEKEADGWKYGPVKDADKKEHPCYLPYEELPTDQKAKDYIFRQIIHSLKPYIN
jgi:hypothetical protein